MFKPLGRSGPWLLVALFATLASACKEEFSDDAFGVIDLSPAYDGGIRTDPARGLPTQINPVVGYVDNQRVEYYDFGVVTAQVDDATGRPLAVEVKPMYFFFTPQGFPLFSTSVRDRHDGVDWIRGGKNTLDPNPKDFCAGVPADKQKTDPCAVRTAAERKRPYPLRERDPLVDPNRHVADYQRPIVDVTPLDGAGPYTGFWEVVEITAPDGFVPDSIKHAETLNRAVASGKYQRRSTAKVINCPMVDERTSILPGITDRLTPRPRIELWYRRKLTYCFLASGWETLGNDKGQLYFSNSDDQRVDTFDVNRIGLGEGVAKQTRLVVPIARAYVPAVLTSVAGSSADPNITYIDDNLLTRGLPRKHRNDPGGYSPVRWMWDLQVESDYLPGGLTSVETLDPSTAAPRGTDPLIRNIPLRGVAVACSYPPLPDYHVRKICGKPIRGPDGVQVTVDDVPQVDASGDPACAAEGLECNKDTCSCDAPYVGYGQSCGPGIAQCAPPDPDDKMWTHGYTCVFAEGGFCYLGCNPAAANTQNNVGKKPADFRDDRCNGLPGYYCNSYNGGVCLKLCDLNVTVGDQCSAGVTVEGQVKEIGGGQTCQPVGISACLWPDSYTPN